MSQSDRRRELAEALQEVAEAQRADADEARRRQKARRPEGTRPATIAVGLAAAGLLAWIWVARPAAVFAPGTPAPLSPAAAEERARVALYLERSRIEDYRRTRGRLPTSLADAGAGRRDDDALIGVGHVEWASGEWRMAVRETGRDPNSPLPHSPFATHHSPLR